MITQFDILGIKIQIVTNCKELYRRLQHIKVRAEQDTPFSGDCLIKVPKMNGRYVIVEEGETLISSTDAEWVTLYVNELVNFRLAHHMRNLLKIHAACGSFNGRRFLLAGEKGAGKTTLITRLLFEGAAVHGDENVLVREEEVIALPRNFHLKDGTTSLVPQLGSIWKKSTSYPAYGERFCFFDPSDAGFEWQITWGKVGFIFFLEQSHGGETKIDICPKWLMAQNLMLRSSDFDTNPEHQIGILCDLIDKSESFIISNGDLNGAVKAIQEILA